MDTPELNERVVQLQAEKCPYYQAVSICIEYTGSSASQNNWDFNIASLFRDYYREERQQMFPVSVNVAKNDKAICTNVHK